MINDKKPNILLITTDTMRWDALSCMGSTFARSPNLDRLAAEGVMFTQAHSPAPVCMPARCTVMSGLHTHIHGCVENGIAPHPDIPSFTDELKKQGYYNIMVGKTHFGPIPKSFDEVYTVYGEKNHNVKDAFFERLESEGYGRESYHCKDIPMVGHLDSHITDKLIERLTDLDRTRPFFAFCSLLSPHSPIDPPKEFQGSYSADDIPPARFTGKEWESLPSMLKEMCGLPRPNQSELSFEERLNEARGNVTDCLSQNEIRSFKALYYSLAEFCDHLVGRILNFLDASGLRENTLVLFTSDHGQQYFDHGFNDKHNYFDETMRVPFIISQPGTLPQGEKRKFASLVDIAPTFLAAAGGKWTAGHGFDLYTPLKNNKPVPRNCAMGAFYQSAALVTDKWKLMYYENDNTLMLFDRENDPGEDVNLAVNEEGKRQAEALLLNLLKWHQGCVNLSDAIARSGPGTPAGPVAARVRSHLFSCAGNQAEKALSDLFANG